MGFRKPLQTVLKNLQKISIPSALGKTFMWLPADFEKPATTTLAAFGKINKGGQTAILVRWSAVQRTTEMLAEQRTGKNSGPAPADYRN